MDRKNELKINGLHSFPLDNRIKKGKSGPQSLLLPSSTILTTLVLSGCGGGDSNVKTNFNLVDGIYTGTDGADILSESASLNNLIVTGLAGDDDITTGSGDDIVRPGKGVDNVNTGDGDDAIVVIGTTTANEYEASEIPATLTSLVSLENLNGQSVSEASTGETLSAGEGSDTIHLFGTLDMSTVSLSGIENIALYSDIKFGPDQLGSVTVTGNGTSILRLVSDGNTGTQELNISNLNITGINQLSVDDGITVKSDNMSDLTQMGISILSGSGKVEITDTSDVAESFVLDKNMTVTNRSGGDITNDIARVKIDIGDSDNITPEYLGRSTAYLAPKEADSSITWLIDLTTDQTDQATTSVIPGYFQDLDLDNLSFSISGADASRLEIQEANNGAQWLVLKSGEELVAGNNLNVDVVCTDAKGASITQSFSLWVVVEGDETTQIINGTAADDILLGGTIDADGGTDSDTIEGLAGNDHLNGGYGDDTLNGGLGDDLLKGRFGDDTLTGGEGADTVYFHIQEINGKFLSADGHDVMTDFQIGTDIVQLEEYHTLGDETDTVSELAASFNSKWNAQATVDYSTIQLVFGDWDSQSNNDNTATLTLQLSNGSVDQSYVSDTANSSGYLEFNDFDSLLLALGGDSALEIV
jgi:Ca2+-binding RTX toxin-like protein